MQQTSSSQRLIAQLSRNSAPYQDPVARIHWERLSTEQYWLPPEATSLYGVAAFMQLPEIDRIRLSQYEFLHFVEAGLWLERIFMERIARSLRNTDLAPETMKYRLHELREEAGHSLMFLELMARSRLAAPHRPGSRPLLVDLFGRYAPIGSLGFWMAAVVGEEIPDRLNRYIRRHADKLCPAIIEMCTVHIIDEARHITYARELLEQHLARLRSWQRALLSPLMQRLLQQFVRTFYYPTAAVYELSGLYPGPHWARVARESAWRRDFVAQCVNPTLQLMRRRGFAFRAWTD